MGKINNKKLIKLYKSFLALGLTISISGFISIIASVGWLSDVEAEGMKLEETKEKVVSQAFLSDEWCSYLEDKKYDLDTDLKYDFITQKEYNKRLEKISDRDHVFVHTEQLSTEDQKAIENYLKQENEYDQKNKKAFANIMGLYGYTLFGLITSAISKVKKDKIKDEIKKEDMIDDFANI